MAEVHLTVGEHQFSMRCRDDERAALEEVGRLLDAKWMVAQRAASGAGPFRVMLLAALLMGADLVGRETMPAEGGSAGALDAIADRLETLAQALEDALSHD